ncbi:hypothetical protein OPT61_g3527 [Boeremia exigua]|uniref:Uncharacterized protein n=1 Tax=Boeremia exigua TaxID=749465 RepID=A0ACC2IHK7_9PLEO|nr:hypothetical protein OPT61_g3527 [Boeremia exigua]
MQGHHFWHQVITCAPLGCRIERLTSHFSINAYRRAGNVIQKYFTDCACSRILNSADQPVDTLQDRPGTRFKIFIGMQPNGIRRSPRFKDDDTRPISRRELLGWFAYGIGAEVFAVCGVGTFYTSSLVVRSSLLFTVGLGSFLPLTLEQLARERGVLRSDSSTPCVQPSVGTSSSQELGRRKNDDQCVIRLLGTEINTASFTMYTFSLAVLFQALLLVGLSAFADHGRNRKALLLTCGTIGAAASVSFILVVPQIYIVGSILVVISVTCLGSSFVVLNSFLPVLVANDPSVSAGEARLEDIPLDELASSEALPEGPSIPLKGTSPELHRATEISSKGVGLGYGAAVFVQLISISILFVFSKKKWFQSSKTVPLRIVLFLVGLWWLTFTLITGAWLCDRPGPPLKGTVGAHVSKWRSYIAVFKFAWIRLWRTIRVAAKLRQVTIFLAAWFLLSDAVATVSATAILFAKTELHMATELIALMSIVATISGIIGAYAWPKISNRFGLQPRQTIMACLVLFEVVPLYGLLEYIPAIRNLGVIGLQQPWEIYPLAVIHGIVSGGLSSYCRSFYTVLIPPQHEAAFFALFAFTDKGSSVIGPAIVGRMVDATGQVRIGFAFLAVLIVLPIPLMAMIDPEMGHRDAIAMAKSLEKSMGMLDEQEQGRSESIGSEEGAHLLRSEDEDNNLQND